MIEAFDFIFVSRHSADIQIFSVRVKSMTVSCENSAPYCSFFIIGGYVISGIGYTVVLFNDKSAFAIISLVRGVVYADVVGICSRCGKWSI